MRDSGLHRIPLFLIVLAVICAYGSPASAIPAFTRAHKVECTTCHTIFPELNEYGEAFLKNSYVYSGKNKKVAKESEKKPEGILLAAIPELLPISFTGALNLVYDNRAVNEFDFSSRSIKLHAGGNFRERVGFFATYVAYSEQPPTGTFNSSVISSNNKTDINELHVTWRHALDTPVNLKAGRLQPKLGLWKTNNRLTVTNNYLPYSYTVGQQSVFRVDQAQDALELNSVIGNRVFLAGGIVNRKGQNSKEWYGHASYKFGGADYLANEPEIDLTRDESVLDYLTVTVGAYGYYGKNGTANSSDPKNNYYRLGLDTELLYKVFRLRLLGGYGGDDNVAPNVVTQKTKVFSKSAAAELEYALKTNLLASGRFEYLEQKGSPQKQNFTDIYVRRYVAAFGYAALENLKLVAEYKYEIANSAVNRLGTLGLTLGF